MLTAVFGPTAAFFSCSMRPPSSSTVFPYTTLFRSRPPRDPLGSRRPAAGRQPQRAARREPARPALRQRRPERRAGADRKSTRLNSSHLGISYAVFCLKKKIAQKDTGGGGGEIRQLS